jgi:hypothetical protein
VELASLQFRLLQEILTSDGKLDIIMIDNSQQTVAYRNRSRKVYLSFFEKAKKNIKLFDK